jgi:hypothetical protein
MWFARFWTKSRAEQSTTKARSHEGQKRAEEREKMDSRSGVSSQRLKTLHLSLSFFFFFFWSGLL